MHFADRWAVAMFGLFGRVLDVGVYISNIWTINIPTGLREVLWKDALGSLPFYCPGWVSVKASFACGCGVHLSLAHILSGCALYDLSLLMASLAERLRVISPPLFGLRSLRPDEWHPSPWFPLIALKAVEYRAARPTKECPKPSQALADSCGQREWAIGTFFWFVWKKRMKELFASPKYTMCMADCNTELRTLLRLPPLVRR